MPSTNKATFYLIAFDTLDEYLDFLRDVRTHIKTHKHDYYDIYPIEVLKIDTPLGDGKFKGKSYVGKFYCLQNALFKLLLLQGEYDKYPFTCYDWKIMPRDARRILDNASLRVLTQDKIQRQLVEWGILDVPERW